MSKDVTLKGPPRVPQRAPRAQPHTLHRQMSARKAEHRTESPSCSHPYLSSGEGATVAMDGAPGMDPGWNTAAGRYQNARFRTGVW